MLGSFVLCSRSSLILRSKLFRRLNFRMPGIRYPFACIICKKRTTPKTRRKLNSKLKDQIFSLFKLQASAQDVLCNKCRFQHLLKYKSVPKLQTPSTSIEEHHDPDYIPPVITASTSITSPPSIRLKIPTTPKSHSRCFICKRPGPKLVVVSADVRYAAFIDCNVIIRSGSRCCPVHIKDGCITPEALEKVDKADSTFVNRLTVLELLSKMRDACLRNNKRLDFSTFSDDEYIDITGICKSAFEEICQCVNGHIRNTPARDLITTVGIFFFKLRSGLSNKLLSTLFGITKSSIRRAIASVRKCLMSQFVPRHLGLDHISREELIANHTRPLAQSLFTSDSGDSAKLILVLDGTYIYIQKSQNYTFQRRSYSIHKGRPLVKPMVIVTTTGYYLKIVGLYLSDNKNSDAKILNHILAHNVENIKQFIKSDGIFIVDRGFRDSLELLQDLGIQAEMPSFLPKGESQMPTDDANSSRLVTKIRWVVESANARIKGWRYLDQTLPTSQVPFIGDFVRIVCAVSNKFLGPLSSSADEEADRQLGARMLELSKQSNILKSEIECGNLERQRKVWVEMSEAEMEDFPRLSEEALRALTCGVYQIKLSPGYIQEHLDGNSQIHVHREQRGLIHVRIQSRHISSKQYMLWLKYNTSEIAAWYCKCRAGARVVGMCAHCAAIIWYLSYARHRFVSGIGVRNWCDYLADANDIPAVIDSSDSDSDLN